MRTTFFVLVALVVVTAFPSNATAEEVNDSMAEILMARLERPADPNPPPRPEHLRGVHPGELLFYMTGPDNAECVRSISDVTGDGLDEVVVGFDESGTQNVFGLDGASSGLATVVWSIQTNDGVSGGAPWGDQALLPIGDPDGNGFQNLLLGTAWGGRTAYNLDGLDGRIVWKFDTYLEPNSGWVYSLAEMSDVTGDGVPECAFGAGSDSDHLFMVNGADTGTQAAVIWKYHAADAVGTVRNIGDVNGDGDHDVLAGVWDNGRQVLCMDGGTSLPGGRVLWTYPAGETVNRVEVLPDITGDGIAEALVGLTASDGSGVRCLNGATGGLVWSSTQVSHRVEGLDLLDDVTDDGVPEVIVASWENAVIVLSGADGSLFWRTPTGGWVPSVRAIDDLDGDGVRDVIAASWDFHAYAMDGKTGETFWAYNTGNKVFSVYPVGDLDNDGRPEVVAGSQYLSGPNHDLVHVLDGNAGLAIFADGFESGDTSAWSATVE